jgi:hypothetical protein
MTTMHAMHAIKIARARALAPTLPIADQAIWANISPVLIERLTGAELAEVVRCMDAHWKAAQAHTERAICDEGAVWDARQQHLRKES